MFGETLRMGWRHSDKNDKTPWEVYSCKRLEAETVYGYEIELYRCRRLFVAMNGKTYYDVWYLSGHPLLGGLKHYKRLSSAKKRYDTLVHNYREVEAGRMIERPVFG